VACVKFPKRDLTSFLGSSLTHVHVLPEGSQKQFNYAAKWLLPCMCMYLRHICVCVREVLSVMCNKVSFYRPASTSGQLLVTPKPQSQPQPQKHNSCPSDWPPDFPPPFPTHFSNCSCSSRKCGPNFHRRRKKIESITVARCYCTFFGQTEILVPKFCNCCCLAAVRGGALNTK